MKHSSRGIEVEVESLLLPAPNRKGGSWLSGLVRDGIELVEYPFARDKDGRRRMDFFLLLWNQRKATGSQMKLTYSRGRGASKNSGRGGEDCIISSSRGVCCGVGD